MASLGLAENFPANGDASYCAVHLQRLAVIALENIPFAQQLVEELGSSNGVTSLHARAELLRLVNQAAQHSLMRNNRRTGDSARRITSGSFPTVKDKP